MAVAGIFQFRGTTGATQGNSFYGGGSHGKGSQDTNEAVMGYPMPRNAKFVGLSINPYANTMNADTVFTLRINGADTTLTATVSASSTSVVTSVSSGVAVSVSDLVTIESDVSASATGHMQFTGMWTIDPA